MRPETKQNTKMKKNSVFRSGSNLSEVIASYEAADHAALVLKSTSADGKWIAAHHGVETEGEWFGIKKSGEIIASGSKSTVNSTLHKKGFKHDSMIAQDRWIKA